MQRMFRLVVIPFTAPNTAALFPRASGLPSLPQGVHGYPSQKEERFGRATWRRRSFSVGPTAIHLPYHTG